MAITIESKAKLLPRLSKAIGHLNAVYRMVEQEKYCIDVMNQLKAVQSALDKTAQIILKDHLTTCVLEAHQNGDSSQVMHEIWELLSSDSDEDDETDVERKEQAASF